MCLHLNFIEDCHTGDTICTDCGLILSCFTPSLNTHISLNIESSSQNLEHMKEKISDILAHLFIFSEDIINFCTQQAAKILSKTTDTLSKNKYLAFSIFESLNILEIPCSPISISQILNVKPEELLKLEKTLNRSIAQCPPSFFVDKITSCLFFPFYFTKKIKEKTISFQSKCFSKPETLIAAIILLQIQIEKQKGHDISFCKHINAKYLAQFLDIAEGSIYRILKELKTLH